jgi:hypothetical protein
MKKSHLLFVGITFMLCLIIACSKDKDNGPDENPPVTNPNPGTNPNPNPNDTTPAPDPVFTDFFPASAMIGDTITLTGENLDANVSGVKLAFGVIEATVISASKTMIKAIVPDDIEHAKAKIRLISGGKFLTLDKLFNLKAPVIESISHTSGFEGQRIKISGKGFRNSYKFDQVTFGDKLIAKGSTTPGTGTLTISAPRDMPAGKYPISVSVAGLEATAPDQFLLIVPVIRSVSPTSGGAATEVTITGENFIDANGGNTVVIFNNIKTGTTHAAPFTSKTNNELKVIVPLLTAGEYKVSVVVLGAYIAAGNTFTYTEPE